MKKNTQISLLVVVIVASTFVFTSCQPAKPDLSKIRPQIQAMEDAYAAGLKAKDANAVIAYYSDDAVSMVNNAPVAAGHDALLKMAQEEIASDTTNLTVSFETVDLFAAGEYVVETGKATYKDAEGKVKKSGKYMTLFEKRNDKYVAIRDMYNEDQK